DVAPRIVRRGRRAQPAHPPDHDRRRRRHDRRGRRREVPRSPARGAEGRGAVVKVVAIPNGRFLENCYLVIDEASAACAIVDPGEEAGLIAHKLAAAGVTPVAIWVTHAHVDHVLGVPRLRAETGAPVYLHPADRPLYDHVPEQAAAFGMAAPALPPPARSPTARCGGWASSRSGCGTRRATRRGAWCSRARARRSSATCCFRGPSAAPTFPAATSTR